MLAAFLTLAGVGTASAQKFSYGLTAGLNLSKVHFSGNGKSNYSSDNRAGWYFGPKVEFNTVLGIGIDAALEYSQRKLNFNGAVEGQTASSESETYRTIEIPVNLRYNIGLGSVAGVYVSTGPQFGFALGNMKWSNVGSGDNFSKQNLNTTWNIGAGVRLAKHLEIGVGYNFAMGKVGKAVWNQIGPNGESQDYQIKYKTNTFQVQAAYLF